MLNPFEKPSHRTAALTFIFITIILDVLALGIIIPVLPRLIEGFLGNDASQAAKIIGLFGSVWAFMQFLCSPILGALSDRFGRRPVILISCFGLGIDYILMALAPTLGLLFLGRVISGITSASIPTAGAYIADITPLEKRAAGFGMIGAAFGFGFIVGPALGGLLGSINVRLPFAFAAVLTLLNGCYGLFILPESLPATLRKPFSWQRANPAGAFTLLRSHKELLGLAGVYTLYFLAHQVMPTVFVLYVGYRYGWNERMTGFSLTAVGIGSVLVQGFLVKRLVARFKERRTMLAGLSIGVVAFALCGLVTTGDYFWLVVPVFALMGLSGPSIQGLMTRHVGATEQGQLQGATNSLVGATGILGPAIFSLVFARFLDSERGLQLPGMPFFVASAFVFCALLLAWQVTRTRA